MSTMGYVTTLTGAEDAASVLFDFKNQNYRTTQGKKNFSDLFTVTRTTQGGRYNEKGLYEMAPVNQPRFDYSPVTKALRGLLVEEQRTNLIDFTDHINTFFWSGSQSTANAVVSPLTNEICLGYKLWRWTWKNIDTVFWASKTPTFPTVGKYTFSYVVAKKTRAVSNYCQLNSASIGGYTHEINLLTGEAKVSIAGKELAVVEDLGSMWRVKIPIDCTATGVANLRIGLYRLTVADNKDEFIDWGAPQLEFAASALSYIPADTKFVSRAGNATYIDKGGIIRTAPYNVGRENSYSFDENGNPKSFGLQLEITGVNLLRGNRNMNMAPWSQAGINTTPFNAEAPDGTMTALRMTELAGISTPKEVRQLLPTALSSGATYTLSCYVKAVDGAQRRIAMGFSSNSVTQLPATSSCQFDIWGDGKISTVLNTSRANIQKVGNGWFRCSFTIDCTNSVATTCYLTLAAEQGGSTYTGDGISGLLLWAPQLDNAGAATSAIYSDPVFTGRSTSATYFDASKALNTVSQNVERVNAYTPDGKPIGTLLEAGSTNLVANSNDMSKWVLSRTVSTPNAEVSPDGTLNATLVSANTEADWHTVLSSTFGTTATFVYTASVFAKAGSGDNTLRMGLTDNNIFNATNTCVFNLKNGTVIAGNGGTITPTIDGWYLCTITSTAKIDSNSARMSVSPADSSGSGQTAGDGVSGIYLWGGMVERGHTNTSFISTTGAFTGRASTATYIDQFGVMQTAASGVERKSAYGYDSKGRIQLIGALRESSSGNLQFPSNGAGTVLPTRSTYVDSGQKFLDGITPIFKLVEDTTANNSHFGLTPAKSFGLNRVYTTSMYVKALGRTKFALQLQSAANWAGSTSEVRVDLAAKTISVSGTLKYASITEMGDGFFRVSATATCSTAHSSAGWYPILLDDAGAQSYTGDGVSGVMIGGWQVELLPESPSTIAPSSYIPTTTGVVNRAGDVFNAGAATRAEDVYSTSQTTRPGDVQTSSGMTRSGDNIFTDISAWYNKDECTVYTEFVPGVIGIGNTAVSVWFRGANNNDLAVIRKDGSVNNVSGILTNSTGSIQAQITSLRPIPLGTEARSAMAWKSNSAAISTNGAPVAFDNVVEVPNPTQLYVGSASNNQQFCNGHIGKIMYYPIRLSNPQLEALTA